MADSVGPAEGFPVRSGARADRAGRDRFAAAVRCAGVLFHLFGCLFLPDIRRQGFFSGFPSVWTACSPVGARPVSDGGAGISLRSAAAAPVPGRGARGVPRQWSVLVPGRSMCRTESGRGAFGVLGSSGSSSGRGPCGVVTYKFRSFGSV